MNATPAGAVADTELDGVDDRRRSPSTATIDLRERPSIDDRPDRAMRGIVIGCGLSLPLWAAILITGRWILQQI